MMESMDTPVVTQPSTTRSKKKPCCEWWFLVAFLVGAVVIIAIVAAIAATKGFSGTEDSIKVDEKDSEDTLVKLLIREIASTDPDIIQIGNFTNAIKNVFTPNVVIAKPRSLQQLQAIVRVASRRKAKLRAVGAAHSYTDVWVETGQILVNMTLLTRHDGPRIQFDQLPYHNGIHTVTVLAGVTLGELDDFLIKNNFTITTGIQFMDPTVVGTVAGCCHGAGIAEGSVSDYVMAMRVVDGRGQLKSYNVMQHPNVMRALQCCVGMCGVIYDVTLQVYKMKVAREMNFYRSIEESIYNTTYLAGLLKNHEMVMGHIGILGSLNQKEWDFVHANNKVPRSFLAKRQQIWYRIIDIKDEFQNETPRERSVYFPIPPPTGPPPAKTQDQVMNAIEEINKFFKAHIDNHTQYWYLPDALRMGKASQPWHFHTTDTELLIQDDWTLQKSKQVIQILAKQMEQLVYKSIWAFPYVTYTLRWFGTSGCYLCPSNNAGPLTFGLSPIGIPNDPRYMPTIQQLFDEVKKIDPDVRVHWVKEWKDISGIVPHIKNNYKDGLKKVMDVRKQENLDPDRIFVNKIYKDIFSG